MSFYQAPEVIARVEGRTARLTLNRPQALNALTEPMCAAITAALLAWRDEPIIDLVLIDHAGERGFCAGGDIRAMADHGVNDPAAGAQFFLSEYRLNELLHRYPKPTAVIMDGIVMGGGVGLSAYCTYRIATERTLYAMPETGIGLFPDIGAGWFLPRLPGQIGTWMALTGARLRAPDCLHLGLATHHVQSARLGAAEGDPGLRTLGSPAHPGPLQRRSRPWRRSAASSRPWTPCSNTTRSRRSSGRWTRDRPGRSIKRRSCEPSPRRR